MCGSVYTQQIYYLTPDRVVQYCNSACTYVYLHFHTVGTCYGKSIGGHWRDVFCFWMLCLVGEWTYLCACNGLFWKWVSGQYQILICCHVIAVLGIAGCYYVAVLWYLCQPHWWFSDSVVFIIRGWQLEHSGTLFFQIVLGMKLY